MTCLLQARHDRENARKLTLRERMAEMETTIKQQEAVIARQERVLMLFKADNRELSNRVRVLMRPVEESRP